MLNDIQHKMVCHACIVVGNLFFILVEFHSNFAFEYSTNIPSSNYNELVCSTGMRQ